MSKGSYTELFFLDEATALAAGHRPCAECRNIRYKEFKSKWLEANKALLLEKQPTAKNIDDVIHSQRIEKKQKVIYMEKLSLLPNGVMISMDAQIYIVWDKKLYRWSFAGYSDSSLFVDDREIIVLTPKSYVEMFRLGFIPLVHESLQKS